MDHVQKQHEVAGYTLSESLYPPDLRQARHEHTPASFSFVLSGSYIENYGRQTLTRVPSTLVFHPPQEAHSVDFQSKPVRILSVKLDNKRLSYLREHSTILDDSATYRTNTISWIGRRLHTEFRRLDSASPLAIEGLVLEVLAEGSRANKIAIEKEFPGWLRDVEDFLRANFLESLVFENVAKIADVHPVYLARVFREKKGCTMSEYVRGLRLEYASREISTTRIPLGEIALAAGFSDHSHLNRTFKTHYGLTPSQYRKFTSRQR